MYICEIQSGKLLFYILVLTLYSTTCNKTLYYAVKPQSIITVLHDDLMYHVLQILPELHKCSKCLPLTVLQSVIVIIHNMQQCFPRYRQSFFCNSISQFFKILWLRFINSGFQMDPKIIVVESSLGTWLATLLFLACEFISEGKSLFRNSRTIKINDTVLHFVGTKNYGCD